MPAPTVEAAYNRLLNGTRISPQTPASQLYLLLGRAFYDQATAGTLIAGADPATEQGVVWAFRPEIVTEPGLIPVPVPEEIFGDVLAMRAAERALMLQPELDGALTLFLAANLRRENELPEGDVDVSYGVNRPPAGFYALLAGPVRLHEVLEMALNDRDAALALDAIDALEKTTGTNALIDRGNIREPLVRALSSPDRRVRFRAAEALTAARPLRTFDGAYRVVPVLSEFVRQSDKRYAIVLAPSQERRNELTALVNEQGFETIPRRLADRSAERHRHPAGHRPDRDRA